MSVNVKLEPTGPQPRTDYNSSSTAFLNQLLPKTRLRQHANKITFPQPLLLKAITGIFLTVTMGV